MRKVVWLSLVNFTCSKKLENSCSEGIENNNGKRSPRANGYQGDFACAVGIIRNL
jgi:hypothetical protein